MIRLPSTEFKLESLLSERTDAITQYLAAIVESSDDAIVSKSLNGIITSWNKGAERIFGYRSEEIVGKPIIVLIPPERHAEEPTILERIRRGERVDHYETVRQRKQGELIDISLTVSPIKSSEGTIIGASKIARDITEQKRREAQILILAREAEHRANNMLSIVLASVQLSHADTTAELKRSIQGRIQALANVNQLFVGSRWAGADLHTLVTQELIPFCPDGATQCCVEGPSVTLVPNTAQALAMTVHELVTNAAKYGALSRQHGRVHVEWWQTEINRIVLRWTERGCTNVQRPRRQGFGTELMQAMIVSQLRGTITFNWHAEGLASEIVIPAAT